jgi:hypothetical protein
MHFVAGWALDRIHILDRRGVECLYVHREASVDQFSGGGTLDQYAVHAFLEIDLPSHALQGRVRRNPHGRVTI